jgi:hypothetical protein
MAPVQLIITFDDQTGAVQVAAPFLKNTIFSLGILEAAKQAVLHQNSVEGPARRIVPVTGPILLPKPPQKG